MIDDTYLDRLAAELDAGVAADRRSYKKPMTYELLAGADRNGIKCLLCDAVSWHPGDVENHYCGRCHLFHDAVAMARRLYVGIATHECAEWPTFRNVCAVCGKALPNERPEKPL